jgi:hypothetical protein
MPRDSRNISTTSERGRRLVASSSPALEIFIDSVVVGRESVCIHSIEVKSVTAAAAATTTAAATVTVTVTAAVAVSVAVSHKFVQMRAMVLST